MFQADLTRALAVADLREFTDPNSTVVVMYFPTDEGFSSSTKQQETMANLKVDFPRTFSKAFPSSEFFFSECQVPAVCVFGTGGYGRKCPSYIYNILKTNYFSIGVAYHNQLREKQALARREAFLRSKSQKSNVTMGNEDDDECNDENNIDHDCDDSYETLMNSESGQKEENQEIQETKVETKSMITTSSAVRKVY